MGWEPDKHLTVRMEAMALELGTEMPFRCGARILWHLERRELPQESCQAEKPCMEGNSVVVAMQRADKQHDEVKLVVEYDGKRDPHALKPSNGKGFTCEVSNGSKTCPPRLTAPVG